MSVGLIEAKTEKQLSATRAKTLSQEVISFNGGLRNMNIYSYIISPDIADHCQKIGHVFNSLEMAVIIAISEKTIKEKHAAWREIIADYPDMPIHDSLNFDARKSLHDFLKELITWEEKCITDFYATGDDVVFRPRVRSSYRSDYGCYRTVEKALEAIGNIDTTELIVDKETIGAPKYCEAHFNSDAEMIGLYGYDDCPGELRMIFIHIPVPFEKGDLLEHDGKPYVLEDLPHWFTDPNISVIYEKMLAGDADGTDMVAYTYSLYRGQLARDHVPIYYYLKYFRGELQDKEKILHYVSSYLKGKIWLSELLDAVQFIL